MPPRGLVAFYWHFARQAKGLFVALFVAGLSVALLDSLVPVFVGRIVTLVSAHPPRHADAGGVAPQLGMAVVMLVVRPTAC